MEASDNPNFKPDDDVILTGWRAGETYWGAYAEKARVKGDWLVPLPDGLTRENAMAVGTAGFTAMMAIQALEAHGVTPGGGQVLVTGAAGLEICSWPCYRAPPRYKLVPSPEARRSITSVKVVVIPPQGRGVRDTRYVRRPGDAHSNACPWLLAQSRRILVISRGCRSEWLKSQIFSVPSMTRLLAIFERVVLSRH